MQNMLVTMGKIKHIKPGLYTIYYTHLKDIAESYGYCLLVHGSMNRDLDLVAVPWSDNPRPDQDMIKEFQMYLTGREVTDQTGKVPFTILPGGRRGYDIQLNRGDKHGEWVRFEDSEYYLDISVIPYKNDET